MGGRSSTYEESGRDVIEWKTTERLSFAAGVLHGLGHDTAPPRLGYHVIAEAVFWEGFELGIVGLLRAPLPPEFAVARGFEGVVDLRLALLKGITGHSIPKWVVRAGPSLHFASVVSVGVDVEILGRSEYLNRREGTGYGVFASATLEGTSAIIIAGAAALIAGIIVVGFDAAL